MVTRRTVVRAGLTPRIIAGRDSWPPRGRHPPRPWTCATGSARGGSGHTRAITAAPDDEQAGVRDHDDREADSLRVRCLTHGPEVAVQVVVDVATLIHRLAGRATQRLLRGGH